MGLVWGNVAQWVSACGSLFALAFAAILQGHRRDDRIWN